MAVSSRSPSSLEKKLALTLLTLMSGQRLMNLAKQTKSASSSLKAILDVDHKDTQSEIVQNLLSQFPTYAEVSPSGNGIHFYGKCDSSRLPVEVFNGKPTLSSRYYVKNSEKGLE